jgi:hypothetical protein
MNLPTKKGQGENVSRIRGNRNRALAIAAASIAVMAAVVGSASGITIKSGVIEATFDGKISPTAFPKKEKAPVTLSLEGKLKTTDGSHISAAKTISLDFDKAGELFTKGLPSCKQSDIESTLTAQAKSTCGGALVGTGVVTAQIAFPEQAPFGASGPLLIFNASKGNKQALLLHVYAKVPAPTTFVVPVAIKKTGGKYGTNAFIKVPTITSGSGSVTSFKAKIGKKWTVKGQKESLLNVACPTGSLFVHGDFAFADGTKMQGTFSKPCTPKG